METIEKLTEKLTVKRPNNLYEAIYILHPDSSEEEQKEFFQKEKTVISEYEGEINHLDTWGKRRLANPIGKLAMGIYFHITFQAQPTCIQELERILKIHPRVIRFFHLRLDERKPLAEHLEAYRGVIAESTRISQEKEAKAAKRKRF